MSKHNADHGRHRPLPRLIKFLFSSAGRAENAGNHRLPLSAALVRENLMKFYQGTGPSDRTHPISEDFSSADQRMNLVFSIFYGCAPKIRTSSA